MYNAITNEIYFPHIIPGNVLSEKAHTWNSINDGMFPIGNFNLIRNKFFGGNVVQLGRIKEYGFYACPHYLSKNIVGFFIDDPTTITDKGKELIKSKYPTATIVWEKITVSPHRAMTLEEINQKKELINKAVQNGANASAVNNATAEELDGLLKAQSSGKSNKQVSIIDGQVVKEKIPVVVKQMGSRG